MTTDASPFVRRRITRDPDDDVDTGVFLRRHLPPARAPVVPHWDREMVRQMTHDLAIPSAPARPMPRAPTRAATIARPNVFLTPRTPADAVPLWEVPISHEDPPTVLTRSPLRVRPPARRRSKLPWVVFAMSFGIAFGVGNDTILRAELIAKLRTFSAPAAAAVEAGARAVHLVVAAERASAPRPLPSP